MRARGGAGWGAAAGVQCSSPARRGRVPTPARARSSPPCAPPVRTRRARHGGWVRGRRLGARGRRRERGAAAGRRAAAAERRGAAREGEAPRGAWDAFGAPLPPWPRDSVLIPAPTPLSARVQESPTMQSAHRAAPAPLAPRERSARGSAARSACVCVGVRGGGARVAQHRRARGAIHSAATDLHSARPPHSAPRCAPLSRPRRLGRVARCVLVGMEVGGVVDRRCHRERRVPWLSQVAAKASNPGRLVAGADPAACIVLAAGARRAAGAGEAHG